MSPVWVVMVHRNYEGDSLIELYDNRESAVRRVNVETPDEEDYAWTTEEGEPGGVYRRRRGSTTYSAYACLVNS